MKRRSPADRETAIAADAARGPERHGAGAALRRFSPARTPGVARA